MSEQENKKAAEYAASTVSAISFQPDSAPAENFIQLDALEHAEPKTEPVLMARNDKGEALGVWRGPDGKTALVTEREWLARYHALDRERGKLTKHERRLLWGKTAATQMIEDTIVEKGPARYKEYLENPWREDHPLVMEDLPVIVKPWELDLPMDTELVPLKGGVEDKFRPFTRDELKALYMEGALSLTPQLAELNDIRYMTGFETVMGFHDDSASDSQNTIGMELGLVARNDSESDTSTGEAWLWRYSELFETNPVATGWLLGIDQVQHPTWDSPYYALRPDYTLPEAPPRRKELLAASKAIGEVPNEDLFDFEPFVEAKQPEEQPEAEDSETDLEASDPRLVKLAARISEAQQYGIPHEHLDAEYQQIHRRLLARRERLRKPPAEVQQPDPNFKSMWRANEIDVVTPFDVGQAGTERLLLRERLLREDPSLYDVPSYEELQAMKFRKLMSAWERPNNISPTEWQQRLEAARARDHWDSPTDGESLDEQDIAVQREQIRRSEYMFKDSEQALRQSLFQESTASDTHPDDWYGFPIHGWNMDIMDEEITPRHRNYFYDGHEDYMLFAHIDPGRAANPNTHRAFSPAEAPLVLSRRVRSAIYKFHVIDPVKYSPRVLAQMFRLSLSRTLGILKLAAVKERLTARGFPIIRSEFLEFMMDGVVHMNTKEIIPHWEYAHAKFEDEEAADLIHATTVDFFWDPEPEEADRTMPKNVFVDDFITLDVQKLERSQHDRWMTRREKALEAERRTHAFQGPIGSEEPMLYKPQLLDENLRAPARSKTVLIDISDTKNANYNIAILDRAGRLREPNDFEYEWIRKRERNKYSRFHYVRWNLQRKYWPKPTLTPNRI